MPLFVYDAVIHAVKRGVYIFVACAVGQIQPHRHVGFLKESIRVDLVSVRQHGYHGAVRRGCADASG